MRCRELSEISGKQRRKDGGQMKLRKPKQEIAAYRGHAIERFEMDSEPFEIPEEHGTCTFYECGVSLVEAKEGA
jgi:hypothetical protein